MSEFSESYHLAADAQQEAADLLTRAGRRGFVFPASNAWVTFVAQTNDYGEPDRRLIDVNTGTLLHYVHAEDHGWGFQIFEGPKQVAEYRAMWEDDLEIHADSVDVASIERLCRAHGGQAGEDQIDAVLNPRDIEQVFGDLEAGTPADRFARLLGLTNFSWISWHYLEKRDQPRGLLEVP